MSGPPTPPDRGRESSGAARQAAQAGVAVASLAEAWLRDTATYAVVLLSLGVLLAGLAADGTAPAVAGAVIGPAAAVAAFVPTIRHWRASLTWCALLAVAAVDALAIWVLVRS